MSSENTETKLTVLVEKEKMTLAGIIKYLSKIALHQKILESIS